MRYGDQALSGAVLVSTVTRFRIANLFCEIERMHIVVSVGHFWASNRVITPGDTNVGLRPDSANTRPADAKSTVIRWRMSGTLSSFTDDKILSNQATLRETTPA